METLKIKIMDCDRKLRILGDACSKFRGKYHVIVQSEAVDELKEYRSRLFSQVAGLLHGDELEEFVFGMIG